MNDDVNKAAQALGRMAAGVPKNFSQAERKRRAERMAAARARRWPAKARRVKNPRTKHA